MNGIFITAELEGDLGKRIHALQMEFDPKMARALPPHITLTGSSGVGPIPTDTPLATLKGAILPLAASAAPVTVSFGPPERFVGRNIVSLRMDPHGPLRALHEKIATCGLQFQQARFPFTPHCTLNLYPELTPTKLRQMMAVRIVEPFTIRLLRVYHTREPQPPVLLFDAPLTGAASRA